MNYQKQDFAKCVFNPLEDNLLAAHPQLRELGIEDVRLIRYAIACYDPNSPLQADIPDWNKRKEMAAYIAGYDLDEEEKYLAGVYSGADEDALNAIHTFLRVFIRSRVWAMIVSNEETFWEYNQRLKQPIAKGANGDDKTMMAAIEKKSKLAEDQEIFHNRINRLYKEFFNGDEEAAGAAAQSIRMNPQQIAKKLSNK